MIDYYKFDVYDCSIIEHLQRRLAKENNPQQIKYISEQ